jgi:hypothetical protein
MAGRVIQDINIKASPCGMYNKFAEAIMLSGSYTFHQKKKKEEKEKRKKKKKNKVYHN